LKILIILTAMLPLIGCNQADSTNHQVKNENKQTIWVITEKTTSPGVTPVKIESNSVKKREITNNVTHAGQKQTVRTFPKKNSMMISVPLIKQNPELRYGCEVTSLAMVLNYADVKTSKMELYHLIQKDPDPLIKSPNGDILRWGNPADGFVGDMTGRRAGYAVFDMPMVRLINKKLPGRAVNLTNQPFDRILAHVSSGYPVVVWTTGDYRLPDRWEGWYHGKQFIRTPLDLHAVVLVGYDANHVYLNDPLSGKKQVRVSKGQFILSWNALQKRAVSYK